MWFLTGFVMLYRSFPSITPQQRNSALQPIDRPADTQLDSLVARLPDQPLSALSLRISETGAWILSPTPHGQSRYHLHEDLGRIERIPESHTRAYAKRFATAPITHVDTLTTYTQWIPYARFLPDMPIYKYSFGDVYGTELYVSSATGEGVQLTDRSSRLWAWLGAIPHWLYLYQLRQHGELWRGVLIWLSGLGTLMSIAGLIVGIRLLLKVRRKRRLSPYKHLGYRWHHILGYIFGIFVCTFAFSGMMSLQRVPKWIIPVADEDLASKANTHILPPLPSAYTVPYSQVIDKYRDNLLKLHWQSYAHIPYYRLELEDGHTLYLRADADTLRPLELSQEEIMTHINGLTDRVYPSRITLLTEYDNYYLHRQRSPALPVYKVEVDDPDGSLYYINPTSGEIRYLNRNLRASKWIYQGLHSFSIAWLIEHPWLWYTLMWSVLIGGSIVSLTGVWLGGRYIARKLGRRRRRR